MEVEFLGWVVGVHVFAPFLDIVGRVLDRPLDLFSKGGNAGPSAHIYLQSHE